MPTLTIRIENNTDEHKALETIKEIFGEKTHNGAIKKALIYTAQYEQHQKAKSAMATEKQAAEVAYTSLVNLLNAKKKMDEMIEPYLLSV